MFVVYGEEVYGETMGQWAARSLGKRDERLLRDGEMMDGK
jgi:hypothetical protein